jgi:hypothetical protein
MFCPETNALWSTVAETLRPLSGAVESAQAPVAITNNKKNARAIFISNVVPGHAPICTSGGRDDLKLRVECDHKSSDRATQSGKR